MSSHESSIARSPSKAFSVGEFSPENPHFVSGQKDYTPSLLGILDFDVSDEVDTLMRDDASEEMKRDAKITLVQKPTSFISAVGSLVVKAFEIGSYYNWFSGYSFVVPLSQAVAGLGIVLCVGDIFVNTLRLVRNHRFASEFVYSRAPNLEETSRSYSDVIRWARKIDGRALRILKNASGASKKSLNHVHQLSQELLQECKKGEKDWKQIAARIDALSAAAVATDFRHLKEEYLDGSSEKQQKLLSRLGLKFVQTTENSLNQLIESLDQMTKIDAQGKPRPNGFDSELEGEKTLPQEEEQRAVEVLAQAKQLLELMEIQISKKDIMCVLGIGGAFLLLIAMILVICITNPWIPAAFLVGGVIVGLVRLFFWMGYGNSQGWECEIDRWFKHQAELWKERACRIGEALEGKEDYFFQGVNLVNGH